LIVEGRLCDRYNIYAIDRPGFGYSEYGTFHSLREQGAFIASFIQSNTINDPIIIAHSYGVPSALQYMADYPDGANDFLLLAGPASSQLEKTRWYRYPLQWPVVRFFIPEPLAICNDEMMDLPEALDALQNKLTATTKNIIVMHGTEDILVDHRNATYLQETLGLPSDHIITLNGADHFLPWTQKTEVLSALQQLTE